MNTDSEIRVAIPAAARVGEGPFWDPASGRLICVDILAGEIHTSAPDRLDADTLALPTLVGTAVPKRSGGFVAAIREGFADVSADGTLTTRLPCSAGASG